MNEEKRKRRNYLINKGFQLKYTLAIVGLLLVVMVAGGTGLYMGMWGSIIQNFSKFKVSEELETARRISDYETVRYQKGDYRLEKIFREAELLSAEQRRALKDALRAVNESLLPKVLLLAVLIFIAGIFVSHKIAGPMYRIEKSAEAIRQGDLRVNFHVRKGDEMKGAASALEDMVESLHADIKKIKAASAALEEKVNLLAKCLPDEDVKRIKALIDEIYGVLEKYKT